MLLPAEAPVSPLPPRRYSAWPARITIALMVLAFPAAWLIALLTMHGTP
jgi:hypothetical protein